VTAARSRILTTSHGTRREAFGPVEWGLFAFLSLTWGASFLLMAVALDDFSPGLITFGRVITGAVTVVLLPGVWRVSIDRSDMPRVVVLAVLWVAIPFTLFPVAQQWIDSGVAGMLNGFMPLVTALVASLMLRELPGRPQRVGLAVGAVGVVCISIPQFGDGGTAVLGVFLVLVATACYGLAANISAPLQQKYGSLPTFGRVVPIAAVLTLPYGLASVPSSSFSWAALAAVIALGVVGTGIAYVAIGELVGRAGPTRASTVTYVIPAVAIVLGVVLRDETVAALSLFGIALVVLGAIVASRREA